MKLGELLKNIEFNHIVGPMDRDVFSCEYDSRKIVKDSLFIANKGFTSDGHDYISKALTLGAGVIVVDSLRDNYPNEELIEMVKDYGATVVESPDTKKATAIISKEFYQNPDKDINLYGITGTKGKTTTTFMVYEIFKEAYGKAGLVGTVCNLVGDKKQEAHHTTPESHELYGLFKEMKDDNIRNVVMEVSSQGLKLDRVYGLNFEVACFTNLYEDHIGGNEHPDMEDYINCKLKIFDTCNNALINRDIEIFDRVYEKASSKVKTYTYGLGNEADICAYDVKNMAKGNTSGIGFKLRSPWYEGDVFVALPGKFNVYNALCAIGIAGISGVDFEKVLSALSKIKVPGRVQPVENNLGKTILVDYAHNAASLESVIKAMREVSDGRIITLFGCGGQRDVRRRFDMGEVSGKYSDYTFITSDNPRAEDPKKILNDIVTGISRTDGKYEVIEDRREAIFKAIEFAQKGDIVLIAGKGHEDYQIFKDKTIHFDDSEVALEAVKELEAKL